MSVSLSNVIQYFHDCYRSDNRELTIYDFLDPKVENKIYFESREELINNEYPIIPIEQKKAENILKKLRLFQKEKELLYAAFFVCGYYIDFKGETKRLCSPLFYFPADIEHKGEFYYLSIKATERRLNVPLINALSKDSDTDFISDPIFKQFSDDFIRFGDISKLVQLIKKHLPSVNVENIYSYPENISISVLKNKIAKLPKEDTSNTYLFSASVLGVVSKSTNTRGVLNELKELSAVDDYSPPLKSLFHLKTTNSPFKKYQKGNIPMILSAAQQAILKSSSTQPLTLVIGPPGTGKSYTIGAIAIEHLNRGESVLIASRTDEAVDVVVDKITTTIGTNKCIVRGGRRRTYSTPLNRYLKALLTRVHPLRYLIKELDIPKVSRTALQNRLAQLINDIDSRSKHIGALEYSFEKEVKNELKWGKHLEQQDQNFWQRLKTQYLDFRNQLQTPIWETSNQLFQQDSDQIRDILEMTRLKYISQVLDILQYHWSNINEFHEALKISSDTERLKKFEQINFNIVLKAFPIWLTNLAEIKDVLPLKKELFDVVIIDEATQCDIASCLPLIQRAKRVVFAGDPNQLRHVSFLSKGIQSIYQTKYQLQDIESSRLNFREKSILDLAKMSLQSGDQVATLDEHFRSLNPIISFSNQFFYENELRIMTHRPDENEPGLYFISCNGKRKQNGANELEAKAILNDLTQKVNEERELSIDLATSLGILSPFRGQVELLRKMLMDTFTIEEINKHKIRVGTAYSFQGEERDQMYLSFAVDKTSHHSAFQHINKNDVFNVSITRARNKQMIYLSVSAKVLKENSLLRSYIESTPTDIRKHKYISEYHDKFLLEVQEYLASWGVQGVWPGFTIAGLKIDLLLKNEAHYIGIDLVGYPGEFENTFGLERFRILSRAGIKVFPLPYSDWYFDREKATLALQNFIFSEPLQESI